jgi:hypothetical protein
MRKSGPNMSKSRPDVSSKMPCWFAYSATSSTDFPRSYVWIRRLTCDMLIAVAIAIVSTVVNTRLC